MSHTPGPWRLDLTARDKTWPGLFQVNTDILTFGMDGEEGIYLDNPADARLLAAAPDLLAALETLLAEYESTYAAWENEFRVSSDPPDESHERAVAAALAAIAKATGSPDVGRAQSAAAAGDPQGDSGHE